ncbi:hypothetical protein AB6A40_004521 [Gnathostoma spinigerum]|uniref:PCI domain-containing protein n=1 Tax=Gnathostoma spinigerum TaxID=75299 RepID=A0ABD6EML8_9BILA
MAQSRLPPLSEKMLYKLRLLTLVSMAMHSRSISLADIQQSLEIDLRLDIQKLFIDAVNKGLIQGRIDSSNDILEVTRWKSRDVKADDFDCLQERLRSWIDHCELVVDKLKNLADQAERAVIEQESNENKIEEEVRQLQKALANDEEQKIPKDARRSSSSIRTAKAQRGRKHN